MGTAGHCKARAVLPAAVFLEISLRAVYESSMERQRALTVRRFRLNRIDPANSFRNELGIR